MKEDALKKTIRLKNATWKQVEELAEEKNISMTKVIEEAVQHLYSEDIIDENIILGRISVMQKKLQYMENKNETFYKLMSFFVEMIFCRLPELPKEPNAKKVLFEKNANLMSQLIISFRKKQQQDDIGFMQSVYGDSQETLEEKYTS